MPFGYWEAKDENDDLEKEIAAKFRKGYPRDNIVFTDDRTAVLWQDGAEVMRGADMQAEDGLFRLLTLFFAHEREARAPGARRDRTRSRSRCASTRPCSPASAKAARAGRRA